MCAPPPPPPTTTTQGLRRPFERARHAHAPPTARRRRVAGAPAARDLGGWSGGDAARAPPSCHEPPVPVLRSSVAEAVAARSSRCATPPSPSAGARSTPCTEPLEQRAAHDVFDIPTHTPRRQRAQLRGGAHVGARAPAAAQSRPRAARSAPMAWALRARAPACAPADNARVASWWWACRCRRRRALCAAREARCTRRFALLPSARVGRGVSDIIMHKRAGERLRATAACAVRVGAARLCNRSALPPGQADPPHFERARAAARRLRGAS